MYSKSKLCKRKFDPENSNAALTVASPTSIDIVVIYYE